MTGRLMAALLAFAVCWPAEAALLSGVTATPATHACCRRSAHQHQPTSTGFEAVRRACHCFQSLPPAAARVAVPPALAPALTQVAVLARPLRLALAPVNPINASRAPPRVA